MRVLLKPKWIAGHLLALATVTAFVNLGLWQLDRHEERAARNAGIVEGSAQDPVPLERLPEGRRDYRPTVLRARFLPEREVLLTPRNERGAGHHVLTPAALPDGRLLMVDRGWVPFALDTPPIAEAPPPTGEVELRGVLLPATRVDPGVVRDERGRVLRVRAVDPVTLLGRRAVRDVFLLSTVPGPADLPVPGPLPETDAGPHLSYAMQWLLFAAVVTVGYPLLLRRAARERGGVSSGGSEPTTPR